MNRFVALCIGCICLFAGLFLGMNAINIRIPFLAKQPPRPTPQWKEHALPLPPEELSTMAGYFPVELEEALASYAAYMAIPTPTPLHALHPTPTFSPYVSFFSGPTGATGGSKIQTSVSPTPTPNATPTAIPSGDTTPPVLTINGGPVEGSVVSDTTICFPLWVVDDLSWWSSVQIRYRIDTTTWSAWANDYQPCISGLSKGRHIFSAVGKDEAGNVSKEVTRTFIVQ